MSYRNELHLLTRIRDDLLMRSKTRDQDGTCVVDLGSTLWMDLCDRIEDIELASAEQPAWIAVEDRLPNSGQKVMWYQPSQVRYAGPEGRVIFARSKPYRLSTHWMPLPEPPKESSDE